MILFRDDEVFRLSALASWLVVMAAFLCGCSSSPPVSPSAEHEGQKTFVLHKIAPQQGKAILSDLCLGGTITISDPNTLSVSGSPSEIEKAGIVLGLVDTNDTFIAEPLAPAAMARTLPSNDQIAQSIGGIAIGTFAVPPQPGHEARAIIDVHGESVVAIVPARLWPDVRAIVELGPQAARYRARPAQQKTQQDYPSISIDSQRQPIGQESGRDGPAATLLASEEESSSPASHPMLAQMTEPDDPNRRSTAVAPVQPEPVSAEMASVQQVQITEHQIDRSGPSTVPETSRGVLKPSIKTDKPASTGSSHSAISFPNGDDVLELSLPEKIELLQLLDLAGEYLHLDCVYDAEKIGNQMITLKLHSKLRSEIRVKDLYCLLETVLKFRGLVMSRREGNLVTIVPAAEALEIDPQLVDPNSGAIQAGDVVVTRVFELQHVDVASVTNLLQSMKLSVAVSGVPETQTLFVTCYAHRMARIEQLVDMIDRPGRPKEFRFRQLKYTSATTLARKVLSLAQELEGITINMGSVQAEPSQTAARPARGPQGAGESRAAQLPSGPVVYLDTDERTNRMLMIGPAEQLETVEGLIEALDVPQQDLRTLHVYEIKHVDASAVLDKLRQLQITDPAASAGTKAPKAGTAAAGTTEAAAAEQPQVVLLETTNSLLVNATAQQHTQLRMVIDYIDVSSQDLRTLRVYNIRHTGAEEVARKLQQLQVIGPVAASSARLAKASQSGPAPVTPAVMVSPSEAGTPDGPQVVVLEATNSLLVNAKAQQHQRIQKIIEQIDTEARQESVPYEIYFLENQNPEQLAQVLGKLIQETITTADGKVEKTIPRTEEPMTIIPDKNTFSLIVHANRKDQDWIAGLIEKLDKRRPQVLIDVTLVEITESDAFNYDLNLIASAPDLTETSGLTGILVPGENPITSADIMDRLAASDRSQFADFQSNSGNLTAFYGDKHINLLLQAIQRKNYGRILAKPKILVNDNEAGTIKTTDTTYVVKRASIPVSSGAAGNQVTLIETAVTYEPYEAGITLNITPHISQGDLLRLDIQLTRSDFRETEDEKPPDTTASELKTTVFVPDRSTIILGGLLRLNQNKGGAKVPILGDVPLIGGLFRSINNRDLQSKLYIFVKTEIIRPAGVLTQGMEQLDAASERNRQAFERHEQEFQNYQSWPGVKSKPVEPVKVLEAR